MVRVYAITWMFKRPLGFVKHLRSAFPVSKQVGNLKMPNGDPNNFFAHISVTSNKATREPLQVDYGKALRKSTPLLTAVPIFGLATGALFPIVALRLQELGSDPAFIGLVTTLYYCGAFLAAVTFGKVIGRIVYRAGFAVSAVCAAAASYALTITDNQLGSVPRKPPNHSRAMDL